MQPEMALLWEVSLVEFVIVTLVIFGGLAVMIGRSTALTWSSPGVMVFYTVLLTFAARFIHFSLFDGSFFLPFETLDTALYYGLIDFLVLLAFAFLGRRAMRARQFARQYGPLRRQAH